MILHLLLIASPAAAHKACAFAVVQGKTIMGEAYFRDGTPIRNAQVTVFDPAGAKVAQTKTDEAGKFSFEPHRRCDHRIVVDAADGHEAQFTVHAEELPASLPGASASPQAGSSAAPTGPTKTTAAQDARRTTPPIGSPQELRGELEAIQAQIVALRRDLAARENATRWRDVLGGIGYILGLAGLAFYFLGARRRMKG